MASRKFRFVSPGVFLREVDNSQLPGLSEAIGPVIIGRTRKGPAMKPHKVKSLEELERVFGKCVSGVGQSSQMDPWRAGTGLLATSYAGYAAKAYLNAGQGTDSPATIVRLLGTQDPDASSADFANAGWKANNAFGVFLMESGSAPSKIELELAAIFYGTSDTFKLEAKGPLVSLPENAASSSLGRPVNFDNAGKLTLTLKDSARTKEVTFAFDEIRKEFNTNPTKTNNSIHSIVSGSLSDTYWLGETFDETYQKFNSALSGKAGAGKSAVVLQLNSGMEDFKGGKHIMTPAKTGWVFAQAPLVTGTFDVDSHQNLFRVVALHEGTEVSGDLIIGIEEIKVPRPGSSNKFGSFTVAVRSITSTGLELIESYPNCNLNPGSKDFVARRIGDKYYKYSSSEKRNKLVGNHPNVSEYIRIEMNQDVVSDGGPMSEDHVPFGFYGPIQPSKRTLTTVTAGAKASATLTFNTNQSSVTDDSYFAITDSDGTTSSFIFKDDSNVVNGDTSPGGRFIIGVQAENTNLNSADASIRQTAANAVAAKIKTVIDLVSALDVTVSVADNVLTITQGTAGVAGNAGQTGALTETGDTNNKLAIVNFANGTADAFLAKPEFADTDWIDNRLGDPLDVTGILDGAADTVEVNWSSAPLINSGSLEQGYFMGISPFKLSYDTGAGHLENGSTAGTAANPGYIDHFRRLSDFSNSAHVSSQDSGIATSGVTDYAFKFSLDEVVLYPNRNAVVNGGVNAITGPSDVSKVHYSSGSRTGTGGADETTNPAQSWTWHIANGSVSGSSSDNFRKLLDIVDGFHMPLVGGFDGVNITESDPFNARVLALDPKSSDNYAYATVDRAIELVRDAEEIEHNLAAMPGISQPSLTTKLVDVCQARADSLAIIDLPDIYTPVSQLKTDNPKEGVTPENAAKALVARQINSSYGATYYPWVKIADGDDQIWVPPSVPALGVMAYTEKRDDVWFAPAGFNRGGLDTGNAGFPVLEASERLLSKDRDTLYEANINPIASFVSEGIVIFGQKTLQSSRSALDRINVRRLLIFVKKEVSRISSNLLFEQNVQATWARFHSQVKRELDSIKVRFGLTDYKVVLDSTTTTADLIDRNVMYAKIFLKPARAIEFIAVDFVITNTGAAYDD